MTHVGFLIGLLSSGHHPSFDRPGDIYIDAEHAETAIGIHKRFLEKIEETLIILRASKDGES